LELVVEGAVQPAGTTSVTLPFEIPPAAAVYVNVIVRPVWLAETLLVPVVSVPLPSGALTVMLGDVTRFVSVLPESDFSFACHVCAPVDDVAVAPEPPPLVSPYVIVTVFPPTSVRLETVIVCPETETVPALAVVYPALDDVVDGGVQPAGTATVTDPFDVPPVAAVYVNVIVRPVWLAETLLVPVVSVPEPSAA
jgi:hypothetical protein